MRQDQQGAFLGVLRLVLEVVKEEYEIQNFITNFITNIHFLHFALNLFILCSSGNPKISMIIGPLLPSDLP